VVLLILSVLLLYSLAHEKLFEFLLFIVTWLQPELAYRQWWLDRVTKNPISSRDSLVMVNICT
jgi:hypothetical protein